MYVSCLGLVSLQKFAKDDLICDYHGKIVYKNAADYEAEVGADAMTYVMEVKQGTNKHLIDASAEICPEHPTNYCLPRLANHVMQRTKSFSTNLKSIEVPLYDSPSIVVFRARRNIEPFEQLRYDYNDKKAREVLTD